MSRNVKSRMQQAACLLLEGKKSKEVAALLGARPETLSRWKKHPVFIAEYERLMEDTREEMRVRLWHLATGVFEGICTDLKVGYHNQQRFQSAMDFFKTIKIEQLFAPNNVQEPKN